MKNTKKKTKVRIWSFALAAVLVLAGFAVSGYASAAEYSTRLGITYERNLSELSEHIDNIETDPVSYTHLMGIPLRRFKTGTPARVHRRTIDFSKLERQDGDSDIVPFSFDKMCIRDRILPRHNQP